MHSASRISRARWLAALGTPLLLLFAPATTLPDPTTDFLAQLKQAAQAAREEPATGLPRLEQVLLDHPGLSWDYLPRYSLNRVDALLALGRCDQARQVLISLVRAPPLPAKQEPFRQQAKVKLDALPEWVPLPGGPFTMGSPKGVGFDNEHPEHPVTVPAFDMLRTEVTAGMYQVCVQAGGCPSKPDERDGCTYNKPALALHPVNCVDWQQARDYCGWAGGRLPSEAEWEYAAAGGQERRKYPWGNAEPTKAEPRANQSGDLDPFVETAPVCSFPAGHSKHGLCDLAGNVWEWVEDCWHEDYQGAPKQGEAWVSDCAGAGRVLRGGSWSVGSRHLRAADRNVNDAGHRNGGIGFRCVRPVRQP